MIFYEICTLQSYFIYISFIIHILFIFQPYFIFSSQFCVLDVQFCGFFLFNNFIQESHSRTPPASIIFHFIYMVGLYFMSCILHLQKCLKFHSLIEITCVCNLRNHLFELKLKFQFIFLLLPQ